MIPTVGGERARSRSTGSSSSEESFVARTYDPKKDLPEAPLGSIFENRTYKTYQDPGATEEEKSQRAEEVLRADKDRRSSLRNFASSSSDALSSQDIFGEAAVRSVDKENDQDSPRTNRNLHAAKTLLLKPKLSPTNRKLHASDSTNSLKSLGRRANYSPRLVHGIGVGIPKSSSVNSLRDIEMDISEDYKQRPGCPKPIIVDSRETPSSKPSFSRLSGLSPRFAMPKSSSVTSLRDLDREGRSPASPRSIRSGGWSTPKDSSNGTSNTSSVIAAAAAFSNVRPLQRRA